MNFLAVYATLVVTSILVGLAALLLWPRKGTPKAMAFLIGALLNAVALSSLIFLKNRREKK